MPRKCAVCGHKRRAEIDSALVGNEAYRTIAKRFGVSESATFRHQRDHLPRTLLKAKEVEEIANADTLLADVRGAEGRAGRLYGSAEQILRDALDEKDRRLALQAIRTAVDVMGEARQYMELRGDLTGELGKPAGGATIRAVVIMPSPGGVDQAGAPGRLAVEIDLKR